LSLAAQRILSHPSLYRFPSSIPGLRLGEMVYHAPRPPLAMSAASAGVLRYTLGLEQHEVTDRRARANDILSQMHDAPNVTPIRPITGAEPGFLRLALLDSDGTRVSSPDLGALRGYPMTLDEHPQLTALLLPGERAGRGSRFLRDRLFTVPTHSHVDQTFFAGLAEWLEAPRTELNGVVALS
jgi:hypothetical protein